MTNSLLSKSFVILRGLLYASAFVLLWAWLAATVRTLDGTLSLSIPLWLKPLGFVLAVAGALLAALCIATFVTTA